ncbi:prepilin-type N-terminal cleavage/methylation domain-containing protein [Verrucomicrobiaceae bacterium N1E253]|uniref:Prepilin-type N-terminal cleavage/methylation domain-containing protein n=1 Tax=Oceaniferula marina TaxID=2748318 RepID=A0A851GIE7_9BACT|nr:prepilin-type N-terminal cleavage/methylation domain-containing protein [Oceaniferula marina]NWK54004.1 prepilin-type N-terminal cleavage/methylation domain-containing protein [Oceaniferula marina]
MTQNTKLNRRTRSGFTLLEVVISLGLMGMLIGMVFRVAQSSIMLSQTVVEEQQVTMERSAFFNLLKNHFEQIPGNAVMRLETTEISSGRKLFTLTFQNVPMSFNWGETPMTAEALELATVEQRDGFIDVVLRFYDVKILEDSTSTGDPEAEPVAEITLIDDLSMCECDVIDGRTLEQLSYWDNNSKLPLQVKLYCLFEPSANIVQQTFWVTPKENPEVLMRQIMQRNPGGPQETPGGAEPPEDGGGTNPPDIEIKPGTPTPQPPNGGGRGGSGAGGGLPPGVVPGR